MKYIKIGEKEIAVRPSCLTPILFKRKEKKDLLIILSDTNIPETDKLQYMVSLLYIMAMQATCKDVTVEFEKAENEMEFYQFIDDLDSKILYSDKVMAQILQTYVDTTKTASKSKN